MLRCHVWQATDPLTFKESGEKWELVEVDCKTFMSRHKLEMDIVFQYSTKYPGFKVSEVEISSTDE